MRQAETQYLPTLMDRLLAEPGKSAEIGSGRRGEELVASIARDLHDLLNTRRPEALVPPEFEQVATSIVNYGIPDFTACGNLRFTSEQGKLCRWIEEAIRTYEPRLRNISVRVLDKENVMSVLRFRVEARLELTSERLSFDMGFKRDSGELVVGQA